MGSVMGRNWLNGLRQDWLSGAELMRKAQWAGRNKGTGQQTPNGVGLFSAALFAFYGSGPQARWF